MNTEYDVVGVGNAIVDILSSVDEQKLAELNLSKGMMTLVDSDTAARLFDAAGPVTQQSGGSAANTIAGMTSFGARCAYIGKIADDELGKVFRHDMEAQGIDLHTNMDNPENLPTASCLIFVTPDAERTMSTHLGVSNNIAPDDLDAQKIRQAKVTYMEGYLFDKPLAKESFNAAAIIAHTAGRKVALTLSDPFCVDRHRDDFRALVDGHIDILFANRNELLSLYETDDIDQAIDRVAKSVDVCAITLGADGAVVVFNGKRYRIDATPVANVIDTTGAGDMFAAGFLYGYTRNLSPQECGTLGAKAAASIIAHYGARPQASFKELLAA